MELLGYISALFMGLTLGMLGGGGSILTVPILVYFFRLDGVSSTTGSLFVVGMTALVGAIMNAKKKLVDFKTGVLFSIPSFAGVFFSRKILLPAIPDSFLLPMDITFTKSHLVLISFGLLMIFASRAMIKSGQTNNTITLTHISTFNVGKKGFIVGCVTGFVGAGGGFLIIPALVLLLHLPMRMAVGTSLAIIAANSLFGFSVSYNAGATNWPLLGSITALGIAGLFIGTRISHFFPERRLKIGFGYFVLVVGLLVLLEQSLRMI